MKLSEIIDNKSSPMVNMTPPLGPLGSMISDMLGVGCNNLGLGFTNARQVVMSNKVAAWYDEQPEAEKFYFVDWTAPRWSDWHMVGLRLGDGKIIVILRAENGLLIRPKDAPKVGKVDISDKVCDCYITQRIIMNFPKEVTADAETFMVYLDSLLDLEIKMYKIAKDAWDGNIFIKVTRDEA
jgi:hypothetical protein